jgi:heptosyltransferase-2
VLPGNTINVILKPDAFSLWTVQQSAYDIAINLDKEQEACMLLAAVKAPEKFGYTWANNALAPATPAAVHKLMTGFFDQLSQQNTKSYPEEIFEICHMEFAFEPYLIHTNAALSEKWQRELRVLAGDRTIIGLNTGCGPRWNTRLWPVGYWEELAGTLKSRGFFPVFLGGSLEHEKNVRMASETGTHYPGHFSLEEFIALTSACDLIVTQVSMMMHIATALAKKMVLMNNIFNRHEFELYGRGEIIEPRSACECYYGNSCKRGQSCMHDLTAPEVADAVLRVVSKAVV